MEKTRRQNLIYSGIGIGIIIIIILLSLNISLKNDDKKVKKQYDKIENYKQLISEYEKEIININEKILQKDSLINVIEIKNEQLEKKLISLETKKQIKKDETIVKIKNIDSMSVYGVDSFFTNRLPKNN